MIRQGVSREPRVPGPLIAHSTCASHREVWPQDLSRDRGEGHERGLLPDVELAKLACQGFGFVVRASALRGSKLRHILPHVACLGGERGVRIDGSADPLAGSVDFQRASCCRRSTGPTMCSPGIWADRPGGHTGP